MTKQAKNTIKSWFKNGSFPNQFHFWDWMDSFFHKDEQIPASQIDKLQDLLDSKVDRKDLPDGEMAMDDISGLNSALDSKVDKEAGKGLSNENFTEAYKNKLDLVEEGANNYQHPSSHSTTMIEETSLRAFISEAEKQANSDHIANTDIHKTSEQIRSEIVDADIPETIARQTDINTINLQKVTEGGATSDQNVTLSGEEVVFGDIFNANVSVRNDPDNSIEFLQQSINMSTSEVQLLMNRTEFYVSSNDFETVNFSDFKLDNSKIDLISPKISAVTNELRMGDKKATGNKRLIADNGASTPPELIYNETTNTWQFSNDGLTFSDLGGSGSTPTFQEVTEAGAETDVFVWLRAGITSTLTREGRGGDLEYGTSESFGYGALPLDETSAFHGNSAFGNNALASNTTGFGNDAFGKDSLVNNTEGQFNSAFGGALYNNSVGSFNSAFGSHASSSNIQGNSNSAFGSRSLGKNTIGNNNSAFGESSCCSVVSGNNNSAFGVYSGNWQEGDNCTFIGYQAGHGATIHDNYNNSTALGANSSISANNQVVLGDVNVTEVKTSASFNSSNASPLGSAPGGTNAINGYVLTANGTGGSSWAAAGGGSTPTLQDVTTSGATSDVFTTFTGGVSSSNSNTTRFGANAAENATGSNYCAFGQNAGNASTDGTYWTAVGRAAGYKNKTGDFWTALGSSAGAQNEASDSWVAIGSSSGGFNELGGGWIAIGHQAGRFKVVDNVATAAKRFSNCVYIGTNTKVSAEGVDNEIAIGYLAYGKGIDTVSLGNSKITDVYSAGTFNSSNISPLGSAPGGTPATNGYVLTANGTGGSSWVAAGGGSVPTLQQVTKEGATSDQSLSLTGGITSDPLRVGNERFGENALISVTTAFSNSAFGKNALSKCNADCNAAFGDGALYTTTSGGFNTALGTRSLQDNTSGGNNTGCGQHSLASNTTGSDNTASGGSSLVSNIDGIGNAAFGCQSGAGQLGSNCTYVGYKAGLVVGTNTFTNSMALGANSAINANNQVVIGDTNVTEVKTFGSFNSLATSPLGSAPGKINAVAGTVLMADGNGGSSWKEVSGGSTHTLQDVTDEGATTTTAVSLTGGIRSTTGFDYSEKFGFEALLNDDSTSNKNSAFGYRALKTNTTGDNNSAFGYEALETSTGRWNSAFGTSALTDSTTGNNNAAFGHQAAFRNITGSSNAAFGSRALEKSTSGSSNVAVGFQAMQNVTTAGGNVAVGDSALGYTLTTSGSNVAIGNITGYTANVYRCTLLGAEANTALTDGTLVTNSVALGFRSKVSADNQIVLGNDDITEVKTAGSIVAGGTVTGMNFILSSDERLKTFKNEPVAQVDEINIRKFTFNDDKEQRVRHGVSAQKLQKVAPEMVYEDADGTLKVGYIDFLLAKVANQDDKIKDLEMKISSLMEMMEAEYYEYTKQ